MTTSETPLFKPCRHDAPSCDEAESNTSSHLVLPAAAIDESATGPAPVQSSLYSYRIVPIMGCQHSNPAVSSTGATKLGGGAQQGGGKLVGTTADRLLAIRNNQRRAYGNRPPPLLDDGGKMLPEEVQRRTTTSESNELARVGRDHEILVEYAHWTQRGYYPDDPHKENQDALGVHPNFADSPELFFGAVFDGHGPAGDQCAKFAAKKLPALLEEKLTAARRRKSFRLSRPSLRRLGSASSLRRLSAAQSELSNTSSRGLGGNPSLTPEEYQSCIRQSFLETNHAMHRSIVVEDQLSGTTAIAILFHDSHVTIANCGDSRAVLGRKRQLSDDPIRLSLVDAATDAPQANPAREPDPPDCDGEGGTVPALITDDDPPRIEPVEPTVLRIIPRTDTDTGSQDHPFDEFKERIDSPEPSPEPPTSPLPDAPDHDFAEANVDSQERPFDEVPPQTQARSDSPDAAFEAAGSENVVKDAMVTSGPVSEGKVNAEPGPVEAAADADAETSPAAEIATETTTAATASSFMALPLSRDQTPWRKDERERVKAAGACVWSIDQVEGREPFHDDWGDTIEGDTKVDYTLDPPRLWIAGKEYPGTAFTRSIGDWIAESIGVIAEPEMMTLELTSNDQIVVIASDGVFEFLTNQEVIDLCAPCASPLEACEKVVEAAYQQWLVYENRTDDISAIVFFLRCARPPIEGESGTSDELVDVLKELTTNANDSLAQKERYSRGISIVTASNGASSASISDALAQLNKDAPHALVDDSSAHDEEGSC